MSYTRKGLFLFTGGASGLFMKSNSKKERTAKALEKQNRLMQQQMRTEKRSFGNPPRPRPTGRSSPTAQPLISPAAAKSESISAAPPPPRTQSDVIDELAKIASLKEKGVLPEDQFSSMRARLLSELQVYEKIAAEVETQRQQTKAAEEQRKQREAAESEARKLEEAKKREADRLAAEQRDRDHQERVAAAETARLERQTAAQAAQAQKQAAKTQKKAAKAQTKQHRSQKRTQTASTFASPTASGYSAKSKTWAPPAVSLPEDEGSELPPPPAAEAWQQYRSKGNGSLVSQLPAAAADSIKPPKASQ